MLRICSCGAYLTMYQERFICLECDDIILTENDLSELEYYIESVPLLNS